MKQILYVACIVIFGILVTKRPTYRSAPDTEKYVWMVDVLLGMSDAEVPPPFVYRIIVPILASPIAVFIPSVEALAIVGRAFFCGFIVMCYFIGRVISGDSEASLVVTGAIGISFVSYHVGASPLTDSAGMFFIALLVLWTLQYEKHKDSMIYSEVVYGCILFLGILTRENVIFVVIFSILYTRERKLVTASSIVSMLYMGFRILLNGSLGQPLRFTTRWIEDDVIIRQFLLVMDTLLVFVPLVLVAWIRFDARLDRKNAKATILLMLAAIPYLLLGIFYAYLGPRFFWPMQLGLIPLSSVAVSSALDSFRERTKVTNVYRSISHRIKEFKEQNDIHPTPTEHASEGGNLSDENKSDKELEQ